MLRLFFSLLITSVLFSTSLGAQTAENPEAWAFRYVSSNFQWPLDNNSGLARNDFNGGLQFEYFRFLNDNFDVSFPLRIASAQHPQDAAGSRTRQAVNFGLDVLLNLNLYKGEVFRPRLYAGVGGMLLETKDMSLEVPMGIGLDFYLGRNTSLSTTFAYHYNSVELRNHVMAGIGFHIAIDDYEPPVPVILDRDGDGIIDAEDLCPDTPGIVALNGCPDRDGDGLIDSEDNCPDIAGIARFEGCPDTDGDGLMDSEDKCPEIAGLIDNEGCPVTDRDGDGVEDAQDKCPDVKGTVANNGCPTSPMVITAKDKLTGEVLPDTEVALVNASGQVVTTGTTNSLGVVELANVEPGNYTIQSKLYGVALGDEKIAASDFNTSSSVQKTVYYDDPNFIIKGKVFYCNSPNPLSAVSLNLSNKATNFMKTTVSKSNGEFAFYLDNRAVYELYAKKESFLSQVVDVDAKNYDRSKSVFVRLEICADEVKCGDAINLDNILYDTGSAAIRPDAMPDLNKVVQFMRDNTDAKVELSSHTDSRGQASSNLSLSQRRAQAAADYIVAQGIPASRVIGKGYGETQLLNRCADGVSCSAAEHQENRRTEFKVICPE